MNAQAGNWIPGPLDPSPLRLVLRPLGQFLGQPTIVSVGPASIGKSLCFKGLPESSSCCVDVKATTREELFQCQALIRSVWMEREVGVPSLDVKGCFQLFYTPGTEIALGSDVVREDLQNTLPCHC